MSSLRCSLTAAFLLEPWEGLCAGNSGLCSRRGYRPEPGTQGAGGLSPAFHWVRVLLNSGLCIQLGFRGSPLFKIGPGLPSPSCWEAPVWGWQWLGLVIPLETKPSLGASIRDGDRLFYQKKDSTGS